MNKLRKLLIPLILVLLTSHPATAQPDTVNTGIYITSIHNIDFKEKEYTINLWLWLKYKNRRFDFLQNLEVPQAKSVNRSFATIDSSREKSVPAHETTMRHERRMGHRELSLR